MLLEVLVAVTLFGLLSVAAMEAFRFAGRASRDVDRRAVVAGDALGLNAFLRRTISSAVPVFTSSALTDRTIGFEGTAATLSLVAPLPEAMGARLLARQRFFLRKSGDRAALLMAWRLDLPDQDPARPPPEKLETLTTHIRTLRFSYFGQAQPAAPAAWHDSWRHQRRLPELVRVQVTYDDWQGMPWPDLIVETKATGTIACVYDPGDIGCRRVR